MEKINPRQSPKSKKNYIISLAILMMLLGLMYVTIALGSLADDLDKDINDDYVASGAYVQFSAETVNPELSGRDYFVNYRLERENYRLETKQMLALLLESGAEPNEEARRQWLNLSRSIQYEGEIENLLKLCGFIDVVSQVNPNSVNLIILSSVLTPEQKNQVLDIVAQITGIKQEHVFITIRN